jgi:CDP-paratose 2-epimerase
LRVVVTGACGFVGRVLAQHLVEHGGFRVTGVDSLVRAGSETNRAELRRLGVTLVHGDLRLKSDVDALPECDWLIDAAANPSVLAGTPGHGTSAQLVEHNLIGTLHMLEHCRRTQAGFLLLSTSRVYSVEPLAGLAVETRGERLVPVAGRSPAGVGPEGIDESFPAEPPMSLYGATKRASEVMALEYGAAHGFPVWIDRCGVLAGAGQFARADQGIFSFWLHRWRRGAPLAYIGFDGRGHQVRDCLHPRDLAELVVVQLGAGSPAGSPAGSSAERPRIVNVGGGTASSASLAELSAWCRRRFGAREVGHDPASRPYDLPWVVLDARRAQRAWDWAPRRGLEEILEEIARHAEARPDWLELTGGLA